MPSHFFRSTLRLTFVAVILLLATCRRSAADDPILALVNGDTISTSTMEDYLKQIHSAQAGAQQRGDFSIDRLLQTLINNALLRQEAISIGLDQDERVVRKVREYRESLAYKALIASLAPEEVHIDDGDLRAGFARLYRGCRLRLICVNDSVQCAGILDSIRGGIEMSELAMRNSVDKFQSSGGYAGVYALTDLPKDLQHRLNTTPAGDLIGPIFLWRVWTIIRLEEFTDADWSLFESNSDNLKQLLIEERKDGARREYLDSLRTRIAVSIDSAAVDSVIVDMLLGRDGKPGPVVLVGDNRMLTGAELRNKYIHRIAGRKDREAHAVLYEVLRDQIDMMLIKEAASRSATSDPHQFDSVIQVYTDSLLVAAYLEEVIAPTVKVTDREIESYFEEHKESFRQPGQVRVALISRDSLADAQADYEKIMSGADFDWIAKQTPAGATAGGAGLQDWMSVEQFGPDLRAQMEAAALGAVLPPVQAESGYAIMRLLDRKPGEALPLEAARDRISASISQRKQFEAIDETIRKLRAAAHLQIKDEAIQSLRVSGPTDEQ